MISPAHSLHTYMSLFQVIRRDITRTYPEHDFFKEKNGLGQESLFNVMKVSVYVCACVGVCLRMCL